MSFKFHVYIWPSANDFGMLERLKITLPCNITLTVTLFFQNKIRAIYTSQPQVHTFSACYSSVFSDSYVTCKCLSQVCNYFYAPLWVNITRMKIWYEIAVYYILVNTLRPRQNGRDIADIFKAIFLYEKCIVIQIALRFGFIWPLSGPMMAWFSNINAPHNLSDLIAYAI